MIRPVLSHEALLADIRQSREDHEQFHLWWLGQSGFLLQWRARHLLLDPYLSDSLTKKYAATDKPHARMTQLVVAPERLDFIDAVTSSHNHTDHLDADTLLPLLRVNPRLAVIVPIANRVFAAERLGVAVERLTAIEEGQSLQVAEFSFTAVPAAHETLDRDEHGQPRYVGYVVRFGRWAVYHSGDTVLYDGMAERLAAQRLDVMLLPINGRAPERRVAGNLNGSEAAELAHRAGARLVIPCHYEMFDFNTAPPDEFVATATRLGQPYRVLRCGEHWSSRELA